MGLNVAREVAALQRMTPKDLARKFADVFGEPTNAKNRVWLVRRIAWRLQALAEGDLSDRARQRASELACDADLRLNPPAAPRATEPDAAAEKARTREPAAEADPRVPAPGTVLTRKYKGATVQVKVVARGFEYAGEVYGSLSAVARAVTGSHCNGFLFFRLNAKGGAA
ncbi:Putative bacteriophage related protein OS=Isosphaera pallida (strain ATCC 43644 / DSM 9630 / IS1B) GN=Isop_2454 PE=4 SV=1: DUF2924 [Gemmataceae bacterium]|nr:Putative bacteriophage related protein OS=Isosphaera pallida (strain ATCC 43644 / DSM 9630 / IS1B) GN=Isop_2454 PE=4 SV=1: DUF2924 [Gemmataceae bacterium]VTU02513.1 Putative bacteriophage related protein OS=Isosphaera pallida (strain ATCC 43644 / DSM 9630 / IS1B) GN=Isop_2454 PE=4 SV=1: DUF2924 [Gemmataceae bacterium]